jgi:hypothetical protein
LDTGATDEEIANSPVAQFALKWAWRTGFAADVLVPWEAPVAGAAKAGAAAGKLARASGVDRATAAGQVLRNNRMEAPKLRADQIAAEMEGGATIESVLENLPEDVRNDVLATLEEAGPAMDPDAPVTPKKAGPLKVDDLILPEPEAGTVADRTLGGGRTVSDRTVVTPDSGRTVSDRTLPLRDQRAPGVGPTVEKIKQASHEVEEVAKLALEEASDELARKIIEHGVDEPLRVASMEEWSEARDMVQRALAKGVPIAERRIMDGLRGRKGEAAELFKWMEPDRTPETPDYRLLGRNEKGQVVTVYEGPLNGVMSRMLNRQRFDDVVMFRENRDVAGWRKRPSKKDPEKRQGQLVSNHNFAAADERAIVNGFAAKHPKAQIPEAELVRQGAQAKEAFGLSEDVIQPVRRFVSALMNTRAPRKVRTLTRAQQDVVDAIEQSLRGRVRATYGTEDLVSPVGGVTLLQGEWAVINAKLQRLQKASGWDPQAMKAQMKDGVATLTEAQQKGLADYAGSLGLHVDVRAEMPAGELLRMQTDMIEKLALEVSGRRGAIRETGRWSANLMHALNVGRRNPGELMRAGSDHASGGPMRMFDEAVRARALPHAQRMVFDGAKRRLGNIAREVILDVKRAKGTPSEKLAQILSTP